MRTVLTLRIYLLYFAGTSAPNAPNASMNTQVPSPNANILSAPFAAEPEAAAKSHMLASAPQGMRPVSNPMTRGRPPLNLHGFVSSGLICLRNGTPHIISPIITTRPPQIVKSMLLNCASYVITVPMAPKTAPATV